MLRHHACCRMTGHHHGARSVAWALAGLVLAALWTALPLRAASLGITPLLVELPAGQATTGVRVSNQHPEQAVTVQARLFRWFQEDGEERYAPADDLALSPPLTRIEPGREHLIRLVRNGAPPARGEVSYRLLLDELPVADAGSGGQVAVSMVLRQSIPVFASAAEATPAQPVWRVLRVEDGEHSGYRVVVRNVGEKRLRLAELVLTDEDGMVRAQRKGLVGYVLGGAEMGFFIADVEGVFVGAAASVTLTALAERGELLVGALVVEAEGG